MTPNLVISILRVKDEDGDCDRDGCLRDAEWVVRRGDKVLALWCEPHFAERVLRRGVS